MENTAFTIPKPPSYDLREMLRPQRRRLFLLFFKDPSLRPPVLDEMMPDLQRVIAAMAHRYSDSTSSQLQYDELVGEGNLKLSEVITKGHLEKQTCRVNFFKFFATAVNNCGRSRVQKYRFTEKRTGQKPPPREQRFLPKVKTDDDDDEPVVPAYHKNVDLSLDDPDLGLQVPDRHHHGEAEDCGIDWGFSQVAAEYAHNLSPVEKLVFHEMTVPSEHARCYAEQDALRHAKPGSVNIKIKFSHMAEAVGIAPELFKEAVLSIRNKIQIYRMSTNAQQDVEARRNATIAQLKQVFGLQIPPDIDPQVTSRLLTMAARDQFDKLNPQVNEMLSEVGAKVPRSIGGDKIACYGVLYQRNCRQCNICDLRHSCNVEAANLGLSTMVQSPKLLGARQARVPMCLPRLADTAAPQLSSVDDAEIINHLNEVYQRAERTGKIYYYHGVGPESNRRYLFCVESASPLRLRFCTPSDNLKKQLEGKQKTWFASPDTTLSEMINLIEQHGKETFQ